MSVMIQLFSDIVRKVFQFSWGVVSSWSEITQSLELFEMASFFTDSYPELYRAHSSGTDLDFNALIRKITPRLYRYAAKISGGRPLMGADPSDYVQEGIIIVWRKLSLYRFICPKCDLRFSTYDSYVGHCKTEYGSVLEPVKTLTQWLDYWIKRYMKNHIRSMCRSERKPEVFCSCDYVVGDYTEMVAVTKPDILMFSRMAVEQIRKLATNEQNPKVRMLVEGCLEGRERSTIWKDMTAAGLAKNSKSACVCVHVLMQRRDLWRPYRAALS